MITIENADKALKDYYLDAITAQLNDGVSPFFSAIEKTVANVYGRNAEIAVVRGNCGNILAGAEDGDLPDPYRNRYLTIKAPLKNLYGTIEISDKALRASRDSSGAFVNLVNAEMEGLISSAKQNFQRMLFGDGTGLIAHIDDKTDKTTVKLVEPVKDWFVGMQVDLYPEDLDPSIFDGMGVYITAIDKANNTIKISSPVDEIIVDGFIYPHNSKDNELCGLGAIFHSPTLYGYKKTEEPYFAPYVVNGKGTLTEELLTDVMDYLEENANSKVNMIICSYKTRRKIAALIADKRRVLNSTDARTGMGVVSVNDVPVYADKYCPDGEVLFINTDDFVLSQLCDWEWLEDESGKILKQVAGKPAYGATLVKYAELICKKPCGQGMLHNV